MKTGTELIAEERQRQIEKEGWTPAHDDGHTDFELGKAADSYLNAVINPDEEGDENGKERPLNYRLPGDVYTAVFESVGAASMCWQPKPEFQIFDASAAEKLAVALCLKIAESFEKHGVILAEHPLFRAKEK